MSEGNLHTSTGMEMCHYYLVWGDSGFLGTFFSDSRIFEYHFLVQFDFFRNNPDFWVLILSFYLKMTLWNAACRALVSDFLQSDLKYSCKTEWQ